MAYNPKPELHQRSLILNEEHEYITLLFQLDETRVFEEGTNTQFKMRAFVFLSMLFFFKFLFAIQLPSFISVIAILALCYLSVELIARLVNRFNESLKIHGTITITSFLFLFACFIVVISFVS